jgi:hypothetical protein
MLSEIWESFKTWLFSTSAAWFMLGFEVSDFLIRPNWVNTFLVAFWIWVLYQDNKQE